MNPCLIDRLLISRLLFLLLGLFLVFLGFFGLLYFFVFVILNDLKPVFGKFIILKSKEPLNVSLFIFLINHGKLYLEIICAWRVGNHRNVYVAALFFWLRNFGFEGQLLGLVDVVEHSVVEVEKKNAVIFEHRESGLRLFGVCVVNGFAIDGFGLDVFLDLYFRQFHIGRGG